MYVFFLCIYYQIKDRLEFSIRNKKKWCIEPAITPGPALETMRLIARKMLYVRCVGLCLRSLHT